MSETDAGTYFELLRRDVRTLGVLAAAARNANPPHDASDWVVTLHFYILCIYAKALGRCRGKEFQDHIGIRNWLNTESDLLAVAKSYRKTEEWSRDARYEGRIFDAEEIRNLHRWFRTARDIFVELLRGNACQDVPVVEPVNP